jgi:hypothetical protein
MIDHHVAHHAPHVAKERGAVGGQEFAAPAQVQVAFVHQCGGVELVAAAATAVQAAVRHALHFSVDALEQSIRSLRVARARGVKQFSQAGHGRQTLTGCA